MIVAIVNRSSLVSDADFQQMVAAVNLQAQTDFARAWDRAPSLISVASPGNLPRGYSAVITMVDTIENVPAGVLGYHTESGADAKTGLVAAQPSLTNGGKVLTGDWSVASILSHEVLELLADPACSLWAEDGRAAWAVEVCDPVEAPTYEVDGVSVSNFCTPQWFDPDAKSGFDRLGLLKAPFTILPGGYAVSASMGTETSKYGDEFPTWRRAMKRGELSRTRRRRASLAPF